MSEHPATQNKIVIHYRPDLLDEAARDGCTFSWPGPKLTGVEQDAAKLEAVLDRSARNGNPQTSQTLSRQPIRVFSPKAFSVSAVLALAALVLGFPALPLVAMALCGAAIVGSVAPPFLRSTEM